MKCPCENCLLIGICKNQNTFKAANFINAVNTCKILYNFLGIKEIYPAALFLRSNLEGEELEKRLDEASKFIPFEEQKVKKKGK